MIYKTAALLLFLAFYSVFGLSAATITDSQARRAVNAWLARVPRPMDAAIGSLAESVKTYKDSSGSAIFHVVKLQDGGFVVTSTDDGVTPIIAFSGSSNLVATDTNPLWVMLNRDMPARRAAAITATAAASTLSASASVPGPVATARADWASLLDDSATLSAASLAALSDVRVPPILSSTWGQSTVDDLTCFNYYTPKNYVCGCVATCTSQLMRYYCWPKTSVTAGTYPCQVDGTSTSLTMQGGLYDWSNMPLTPSSPTEAQRQAIGKLTSDVGISVKMSYTATSSGASLYDASARLTSLYHYSSAKYLYNSQTQDAMPFMTNAILPDLDYGAPVLLGITGDGGHAIVGDGYGFSGNLLYLHLNMGWSGSEDAWYNLPTVSAGGYNFTVFDEMIFNIFTNGTGEIISGRVLDSGASTTIEGATVTAYNSSGTAVATTISSPAGVYAVRVPASNASYTLKATFRSVSSSGTSVKVGTSSMAAGSATASNIGNRWGNNLVIGGLTVVPVSFSPESGTLFESSLSVALLPGTSGVPIYYTLDGSTPTTSSTLYTNPITITAAATIHAVSYYGGICSPVYSATFFKADLGAGVDASDYSWTTSADWPWTFQTTNTYDGVDAVQSAVIDSQYGETSWIKASGITGPGTLSFWYKTRKYASTFTVSVDSANPVLTNSVDESNGAWQQASIAIPSGPHSVTFSYYRGGWYTGINGVWLDQVVFAPAQTTNSVPVPYTWLNTYYPSLSTAEQYNTAALGDSDGDGFTAWEEYLAGTDPTNPASFFQAGIRMANGLPVIEWNITNSSLATYSIFGAATPTNTFIFPTNSTHRFFRVHAEKK